MQSEGLTDLNRAQFEVDRYQAVVDAEAAEHETEDMEVEDNDYTVNAFNPDVIYYPDPFGHHRLYRELQSEQYLLDESLRQWRLEREID